MLELSLPPGRPRRAALEEALRSAIRERRLVPGARLPSTRALADDLSIARGTVVEAYGQLRAEGYLTARHGGGTWVAEVVVTGARRPTAAPSAPRAPRFNFNPGLPDLTAFPYAAWARTLRHSLRDLPASALGYGDPRGNDLLRAALAEYLGRARGAVADPERIVVCAGFVDGLALLTRLLRRRGLQRVAMEDPCLHWHRDVVVTAGLEVVAVPVDNQGARSDLLAECDAGLAVLTPAHQFPSGAVLHPERRTAAVAWARAGGGLVLEDDYDAELRYDRQPVGALQALDPEHVVYAGTVSKSLAPGLRLGWLLLPDRLVEPTAEARLKEGLPVSIPDQLAFAELLRSGAFERHLRRMRNRYRARRDRVLSVLAERVPEVRPVGISAGLRVLLELPDGAPPAEALAAVAAERSIELFPLGPCFHEEPAARNGVVLGYAALPEHTFESGLRALCDLLRDFLAPVRGGPKTTS